MSVIGKRITIILGTILLLSSIAWYWYASRQYIPENFNKENWFKMIRSGNVKAMKVLLDNRLPPTIANDNRQTSLRTAILGEQYSVAKILVKYGAEVNEKITAANALSLITLAIYTDQHDMVKLLLESGAKTTLEGRYGLTPLRLAIKRDKVLVMAEMLAQNPNAFNAYLSSARKSGIDKKISLFIKEKLDYASGEQLANYYYILGRVNEHHNKLSNAKKYYMHAQQLGSFISKFRLLSLLTNPNSGLYNPTLGYAIDKHFTATSNSQINKFKFYLSQHSNHNSPYAQYILAKRHKNKINSLVDVKKMMMTLAQSGYVLAQHQVGDYIYRYYRGKNKFKRKNKKIYWLSLAAKSGLAESAHDLAKLYLDPYKNNVDPAKALYWYEQAATNGYPKLYAKVAAYLLNGEKGLKIDLKKALLWLNKGVAHGDSKSIINLAHAYTTGEYGLTLNLSIAYRTYQKLPPKLRSGYLTSTVYLGLNKALGSNHYSEFKSWIERTTKGDKNYLWAKRQSLQGENTKITRYFFKTASSVNGLLTKDTFPLGEAARVNNLKMVQHLVSLGAKTDKHPTLKSALYFATKNNNITITKVLLSAGANPNVVNQETPLTHALKKKNITMLTLLINKGADVNLKNSSGESPFQISRALVGTQYLKILLAVPTLKISDEQRKRQLDAVKYSEDFKNRQNKRKAGKLLIRIDKTGKALADQNQQYKEGAWSCVSDKVSGLLWTVKGNLGDIHDHSRELSLLNSKTCKYAVCGIKAYIDAVNSSQHCGHSDWRLPTPKELSTLAFAYQKRGFPYWPGFSIWTIKDEQSKEIMITWASGLLGKTTAAINMQTTAKALLVRGKNRMPSYTTKAYFYSIRFKNGNLSLDMSIKSPK